MSVKAEALDSYRHSKEYAQILFDNEEAKINAAIKANKETKVSEDYLGKAGDLLISSNVFSSSANPDDLRDGLLKMITDNQDMDELTKLRLKQGVADLVKDVEKDGVNGFIFSKWNWNVC